MENKCYVMCNVLMENIDEPLFTGTLLCFADLLKLADMCCLIACPESETKYLVILRWWTVFHVSSRY